MLERNLHFAIDRGGTFTDVYVEERGSCTPPLVLKLLSCNPSLYSDAPTEGIRRALEHFTGCAHPAGVPIDTSRIACIRMGTTVATNALLERKGARCALVTNSGFADVLQINTQARPKIFDLRVERPDLLYERVITVQGRVRVAGPWDQGLETVSGVSGEDVIVVQDLELELLAQELQQVLDSGISSLCVALLHSYTYPEHERRIGALARDLGFTHVSLSSSLSPMVKLVSRGSSACVDAYLSPCITAYLDQFVGGFASLDQVQVLFMQSDGGLSPLHSFSGYKAVLSGPAGGVVGYSSQSYATAQVIGFDMGGTSTDVSRYAGRALEHVMESTISGVVIQAPQLEISTVAAGGGSMLFYRHGLLVVGPESAGALPGPACYRNQGPLTVTDANLVLGRIHPDDFPRLFGPSHDEPMDTVRPLQLFQELCDEISRDSGTAIDVFALAAGFLRVANEAMCRPIRDVTQGRGYTLASHSLAVFGGAGGQHGCAIARQLGISKVYVHEYGGILSAYGISLADVVVDESLPMGSLVYSEGAGASQLSTLRTRLTARLLTQGFDPARIELHEFLGLRYEGTDTVFMVSLAPGRDPRDAFRDQYTLQFGFALDRAVLLDDVRVRGLGKSCVDTSTGTATVDPDSPADSTRQVYFTGEWHQTRVFHNAFKPGFTTDGPAILTSATGTLVVEPRCRASFSDHHIRIDVGSHTPASSSPSSPAVDPIMLSVFSHRFMSIAEQMGKTLQQTAISTNIKERLDFSCALFGPQGDLVSNAPHLPVHLGAMQDAVKFQLRYLGADWGPGDVVLSNHPSAGGSHLPDITVMTPVFSEDGRHILFFLASRGHHADVGGLTPGSMPPFSKALADEGVQILSFKLLKQGEFQLQGITEVLERPGSGAQGTRCLRDNVSDLKAQVAANEQGRKLVTALIAEYSVATVHGYMGHIRDNAEASVRAMLVAMAESYGTVLSASDSMDDGSRIALRVTIDGSTGSAVFDFGGTAPQVLGNTNAPKAVTYSAVIYALRCLVDQDIPLNQGCLAPVEIRVPDACLLNPSRDAAVVGGNVLTSQRVTDVILRAFRACAASQGCMNNLTFGDHGFGYYETIAGGAGAGPSWAGQSGVHTHMTNTRITDAEVLERRYPVHLDSFMLRTGSGGVGRFPGGQGVLREMTFLAPLTVGILSERRVFAPYGLDGGGDGARGRNSLIRAADGVLLNLGSKNSFSVRPGDRIRIETPGGGGYGLEQD